ncbi:hypothetical protein AgCh_025541 [Apium graveolens]
MAYATDEERMQNKPHDIPLEDYKILLKYWGYPDVQGKNLAPGQKPCDEQIFIKTRKGKPDRQYKINPDVINFRIETLEKKLNSSEGLDGVDELISGGKNPMLLVGSLGDMTQRLSKSFQILLKQDKSVLNWKSALILKSELKLSGDIYQKIISGFKETFR